MDVVERIVYDNVIDTTPWTGPNPTWSQQYTVRAIAVIGGTLWAFVFQLAYFVVDKLSTLLMKRYRTLNKVQKADWTSRMVAMGFIVLCSYFAVQVLLDKAGHKLIPAPDADQSTFASSKWLFSVEVLPHTLHTLYIYYIICFGYELYDLKNCIDIKMYSGVIHHLVLLVIFPLAWEASTMSIPAMAMVSSTYLSNIPAHFRSFMVILGHRDSQIYKINKWLWWISYVIFRLFGIPWFSSVMYFSLPAVLLQVPVFPVAWYFSAMAVHYALSLYWFVEMTKTMFPPDKSIQRVGSYPIFPQDQSKAAANISASRRAGKSSDTESSDDEGGQKFD